MHKLTFYPLGNADSCCIELANGKMLQIDYAAMRDANDPNDKRADLPTLLRQKLKGAKRSSFNVVAFTHLDNDHICGASEFFHLEHAAKYQGGDRIKIDELWVPAAAIIEEGAEDEARIIRQEARHRLEAGKGIRVFSRPERLKDWLKSKGLELSDREHLITDAGKVVPGLTLGTDGVEFFVHSPFAKRQNEKTVVDRNVDSLVLHGTFEIESVQTKVFFGSDIDHDVLADIVDVTEKKKRGTRLESHVVKLPHHCSYKALSADKGTNKTTPDEAVARFYNTYCQRGVILVSTSKSIPTTDTDQPPHRQAAAYYRDVRDKHAGRFLVTMDHPSASGPGPMEIQITRSRALLLLGSVGGVGSVLGSVAPRAGAAK